MKWQRLGFVLILSLAFSGCSVHTHRDKKAKRHKNPVKTNLRIVPEHQNKQVIYKIKTVEIVRSDKIGQNH
ncbi:MAG: hypothetical protein ACI9LM_003773 [Alteromonadaceae bacterium]|jgi:hypothetical protein